MKPIAFLTEDEILARIAAEKNSEKAHKMTAEQIDAIYSNGTNILVSASAGSGKTFVMVERILDMIKRGIGINQLFISTFTVKAAGELRERLEKRLTKALLETEDEELRHHLSEQLALLPSSDIGTMDAFTQKMVGQFGHLIGISPQFRILTDKSEQDLLKQTVYIDLFEDYLSGKDSSCFQDLVEQFAGNRKDSQGFRQMVYKVYAFSQATADPKRWLQDHFLRAHERMTTVDHLPSQMIESFLECITKTINSLKDIINLPDYSRETKAGKPTATYTKHLKMIEQLENALELYPIQYGVSGIGELACDVAMIIPSGNEVTVNKVKYPIFKALQEQLKGLKHLDTIFKYQNQALPLLSLMRDFVSDFSDQYLQAKMQENTYEFSDIAHFAIRILEEHQQVAEQLQSTYHEVMVDEYQDNNHTQERLLELISNGSNRFMVGDIKQSIYRFRQADPQIFNQKFKLFKEQPDKGKLIILKENFRSQSCVLDATNGVFRHLMDEQVGDVLYDATHMLSAGSDRQKEIKEADKTQVLIYNTDEDVATDQDDQSLSLGEIDLVAKEIIRLHNEEKVSFSEITLLVSSRTRNEALLKAFEGYGIPLVADSGQTNYLKSLEVSIMLDTLRVINNPLNDYALVALMRSPMFSFDEDDLTRLAIQADKGNLYDKIRLAKDGQGHHQEVIIDPLSDKLRLFHETLRTWRQFSKGHSLYELIWKIYRDRLYLDYVGALPNAEQRQANLRALALRANQYEQSGFKGLSRFIDMIEKMLQSQNDLADVEVSLPKNAVQLLTIHKSKGLEFPYVFILNIDKQFSLDDLRSPLILSREFGAGLKYLADMKADFPESTLPRIPVTIETLPYQHNRRELKLATLSEQMRLLYVAMTRAEKRLYLVGKGSRERANDKYGIETEHGRLPVNQREQWLSFQDWLLAINAAFPKEKIAYDVTFVEASDLTADKIGRLEATIKADDLSDNRQSDEIRQALDLLESVDHLNTTYQPAILLPSVRTPSQIKQYYEPIVASDGIDIMDRRLAVVKEKELAFTLPNVKPKTEVTASQIGSATHELMQRIPLSPTVKESDIRQALAAVKADDAVKEKIDLAKIQSFFSSKLGKLIQTNEAVLYRESPFAMLMTNQESGEEFVVRGIVDGYLLFDDRIILFDYKTDRFKDKADLVKRYQGQMALYAKALSQSYGIANVEAFLVLLGGQELEIVRVPVS